jgi:hypothetical protein
MLLSRAAAAEPGRWSIGYSEAAAHVLAVHSPDSSVEAMVENVRDYDSDMGEGAYAETARQVRKLLAERAALPAPPATPATGGGRPPPPVGTGS